MTIYWSATAPGFYDTTYYPEENIPADKVEVTPEDYQALLVAQHEGQEIVTDPDTGGAMARDRPPPPPPTLEQQAQALLVGPVTVDCTTAPELSAVYENNVQIRAAQAAVVSQINAGMGTPGPTDAFNWPDIDGTERMWPSAEFVAFANALVQFAYDCNQVVGGFSTTLPSTTLTVTPGARSKAA